ncbi:MAG TPA: translesion error-prone DNA polymerase V autoproteolytic subunit [Candidatus Kapabacteria bacterium]|nr:translesion error-prone DNA polymerase V autoproteolytic subunit [Candidatus Kapabacteria bacterium]
MNVIPFFSPTKQPLPYVTSYISAGFPSPADDHVDQTLDLHEYLVKHPAATFFVRVEGESMTGAGIFHGDLLVVDRSLTARDGSIVIAVVNGELTVKRLRKEKTMIRLVAENPAYTPIVITEETELVIWGVVTSVIHHV